jgi:hypothetical protein
LGGNFQNKRNVDHNHPVLHFFQILFCQATVAPVVEGHHVDFSEDDILIPSATEINTWFGNYTVYSG